MMRTKAKVSNTKLGTSEMTGRLSFKKKWIDNCVGAYDEGNPENWFRRPASHELSSSLQSYCKSIIPYLSGRQHFCREHLTAEQIPL